MPRSTKALGLCLALLAAPAAAQEGDATRAGGGAGGAAIPLADPPESAAPARPAAEGAAPPARVVIELGDVEVKVRRLRIVLTLDPDRAAALGEALTGAAVRAGAEPDG